MAFGRLERSDRPPPMSDINMTPLIDVMLVLLVIFMVTAPLMASGLRLDLPKVTGAQPVDAPRAIGVAIDAQGRLRLADEPVDTAEFEQRLADAARRDPRTEVQLRADRSVAYGRVAEVIGLLQKSGLRRIGFITEAEAASAASR